MRILHPGKMDSQRQRMRPWLEAKVNSGTIKGLQWIDKTNGVFRVPWKHGGKHDWNEEDSLIFKEWALHTGRYRKGVDQTDYPTWKTRFRCALNKLPDIQEVKDCSKLDGTEPFRAYRFLTKEELQQVKAKSEENRMSFDLTDLPRPDSDQLQPSGPLPDVVVSSPIQVMNLPNLPSDLDEIKIEPFKSDSLNNIKQEPMDMDTTDGVQGVHMNPTLQSVQRDAHFPGQHLHNLLMNNVNEPSLITIRIKVRYCQKEVLDKTVVNPCGCRLYHGQQIESIAVIQNEMYGNPEADQIQFPVCESPRNPAQESHTRDLLNAFERGLILECHNGCVYATRKSRCVIFISSPIVKDGEPFKLERDKKVKVYDYFNYFDQKLQQCTYKEHMTKPKPYFMIGFGQKLQSGQNIDNNNLLISGIVYHSKAQYRLNQVTCCSPMSPAIEVSKSDEYDKFLKEARQTSHLHLINQSVSQYEHVNGYDVCGFNQYQQNCAMPMSE